MNEKPKFVYSLDVPVATVYTDTLIQARAFKKDGKDKGDPKFGATFLFNPEHPDLKNLKQKAIDAAQWKRPGVDLKSVKWPWTNPGVDADKAKALKKDREFLRPFVVLKARSIFEVALSVLENGAIVDLETPAAKNGARDKFFYNGVLCGAVFSFVPYDRDDGGIGVTAYLNRVLSTGAGDPIKVSSGPSGAEVFSKYAGRPSQVDPGANSYEDI